MRLLCKMVPVGNLIHPKKLIKLFSSSFHRFGALRAPKPQTFSRRFAPKTLYPHYLVLNATSVRWAAESGIHTAGRTADPDAESV